LLHPHLNPLPSRERKYKGESTTFKGEKIIDEFAPFREQEVLGASNAKESSTFLYPYLSENGFLFSILSSYLQPTTYYLLYY